MSGGESEGGRNSLVPTGIGSPKLEKNAAWILPGTLKTNMRPELSPTFFSA